MQTSSPMNVLVGGRLRDESQEHLRRRQHVHQWNIMMSVIVGFVSQSTPTVTSTLYAKCHFLTKAYYYGRTILRPDRSDINLGGPHESGHWLERE